MLTDDQKRTQLNISRYLLFRYEDDSGDFIGRVVTKMRHGFTTLTHPESKMQSKQWKHFGSPPPKKFKRVHPAGKAMTSIILDSQWVIMVDYPMQSGTINCAYIAGKWRQLCQEISRKWRGKLTRGVAPAHTSQIAITATTECGFEILPHPPYSSDMALSDCCGYLFLKLKSHLRCVQYGSNEGVIEAVNEYLWARKRSSIEGIRKIEQRWAKCILKNGDYIEKQWSFSICIPW